MKQSKVLDQTEQTAVAIARLPVEQWPDWVTYILEVLDGKTDLELYEWFLERLCKDITARLNMGRW
jgi:hypothetical protein